MDHFMHFAWCLSEILLIFLYLYDIIRRFLGSHDSYMVREQTWRMYICLVSVETIHGPFMYLTVPISLWKIGLSRLVCLFSQLYHFISRLFCAHMIATGSGNGHKDNFTCLVSVETPYVLFCAPSHACFHTCTMYPSHWFAIFSSTSHHIQPVFSS